MIKKYYPKNLVEKWRKFWKREKIYKFNFKSKKPIFSVDVPPITPSGKMHVGHLMHYLQFEFIARYKRMKGFEVFFPLCFDDNGLPTEKYVEEIYGISKGKTKKEEFQRLCYQVATKLNSEYGEIFSLIGFSGDSEIGYRTIDQFCQKQAQRSFLDLYKKGQIYRKEEPVIWCPFHQTALSQAEVDDLERDTFLYYFWFQLEEGEKIGIATTRPELLPACVGIFIHPKDKRKKELIKKKVEVPLFGQKVSILSDKKVDPNFGTGIVMVCTFGDKRDIDWWKQYNLPLKICLTKEGKLNEIAGNYQGLTITETRKKIVEDLEKKGILYKKEKLRQRVNVCWRCKTPIEFLVTPQWFIKVLNYKKELIELAEKLKWYPAFYQKRYENWIKNLKWDWCISRQRYYGVPFPVWYCQNCQKIILPKEKNLPVNPQKEKPKEICPCGSKEIFPELDVFDTWMTSSITPLINSQWKEKPKFFKKLFPLDLRPQGHDIIRTWLFYSLLKSFLHLKKIPFKTVIISGHGLDEKGRKMSKSLGNIIEAREVLKKYPSDAIRYWAANGTLGRDLKFDEKVIKKGHRLLTKIWNAFRLTFFFLKEFNPKNLKRENLYPLDRWLLSKLQKTIKNVTEFFDQYQYFNALREIERFFWRDFCDNYLELVKWRLYSKDEKLTKESAKFTLYHTFFNILKIFAPFLPFLSEEIYSLYFQKFEKGKSIHLLSWPKFEKEFISKKIESSGDLLIKIIEKIRKEKSKRGYSLKKEGRLLKIGCPEKISRNLKPFLNDLKAISNIKKIEFSKRKGREIKIYF